MNYLKQIEQATDRIKDRSKYIPTIGIILGSGLGSFADELKEPEVYTFDEIPHMPDSTVKGHAGRFVIGKCMGKQVVVLQGRLHYYEGYAMQQVCLPVRIMRALGVHHLIITSACGGLNDQLHPGALMFVKDHINLMGTNPLIGENFEQLGPRFPDMSEAYHKGWREKSKHWASSNGIKIFEGVHVAVTGPYFYSHAELKMVKIIGGDTIGMSMVPEIIVGVHGGMTCLGIACVTDMAIPDQMHEPLTHETVMEVANRSKPTFIKLLKGVISVS